MPWETLMAEYTPVEEPQRHKFPEMKLPADPDSRRAATEMVIWEAVRLTYVLRGCNFPILVDGALTSGRGGRVGHSSLRCPALPQYKQRFWVSLLCLSANEILPFVQLHGFSLWFEDYWNHWVAGNASVSVPCVKMACSKTCRTADGELDEPF